MSRYRVLGSAAECEPGSNGLVLRNRLGISDPVVMDEWERNQLLDLYQATIGKEISIKPLRISDLLGWHSDWLSKIYDWAGKIRTFNLSKQGFAFASAHLLPELLAAFESEQLTRLTPFQPETMPALVTGLADVHLECDVCKGKRFKEEVLDVQYNGKNIHELLEMSVDQAIDFLNRMISKAHQLQRL